MSVDPNIYAKIKEQINSNDKVMVILDSDHSKSNVLKELELYSKLITVGNYLVVEDTNVNGNPVNRTHGAGPNEAVEEYLRRSNNGRFIIDREPERYLWTYNPNGYLRREK